MAKKTVVNILDDFDGTPGATTVRFGYGGTTWFTIDLAGDNLKAFHAFFDRHIDRATPLRPGDNQPAALNGAKPRRTYARQLAAKQVRGWWKERQTELELPPWKSHGKIPTVVQNAYRNGAG
jgi:hypothetical protein